MAAAPVVAAAVAAPGSRPLRDTTFGILSAHCPTALVPYVLWVGAASQRFADFTL